MNFVFATFAYSLLLFLSMLALGEAGRILARRRAARDPEGTWQGIGVIDGAVFALLGLIIAFTFSGAVSRFDARRQLIVEETNDIGTAYLRLDLLPAASQPGLREAVRDYLDSRLRVYALLPNVEAAKTEVLNSNHLQTEIWSMALAASRDQQAATMLLVPALNAMFDIATTRVLVTLIHPPPLIFYILFVLSVLSAGLAGYEMARDPTRNWLHLIAFAGMIAAIFYVIVDLEYPRAGLIQIADFDQALIDLRASMN